MNLSFRYYVILFLKYNVVLFQCPFSLKMCAPSPLYSLGVCVRLLRSLSTNSKDRASGRLRLHTRSSCFASLRFSQPFYCPEVAASERTGRRKCKTALCLLARTQTLSSAWRAERGAVTGGRVPAGTRKGPGEACSVPLHHGSHPELLLPNCVTSDKLPNFYVLLLLRLRSKNNHYLFFRSAVNIKQSNTLIMVPKTP